MELQDAGVAVADPAVEVAGGPASDAEVGGGPGPADSAGAAGAGTSGSEDGLMIYAQAYTPDGHKVISSWHTGERDSVACCALASLRRAGWLDGEDQPVQGGDVRLRRRHALAAALLVATAALDSARLETGVSLSGTGVLLDALLDGGARLPGAELWESARVDWPEGVTSRAGDVEGQGEHDGDVPV